MTERPDADELARNYFRALGDPVYVPADPDGHGYVHELAVGILKASGAILDIPYPATEATIIERGEKAGVRFRGSQ